MTKDTNKRNHRLLVTGLLLIVFVLSTEIARSIYRENLSGERRALKEGMKIIQNKRKEKAETTSKLVTIDLIEEQVEKDWERYENVREGQNCSADLKWFRREKMRPIVAISRPRFLKLFNPFDSNSSKILKILTGKGFINLRSFPGSGNTWARHLLHMASGYWTGNRRSSNHLKSAGWLAEDNDCKDRTRVRLKLF